MRVLRRDQRLQLTIVDVRITRKGPAGGSLVLFVPGALLTTVGALILLMPDLLAYLVAAFLIVVGIFLLGIAWQMRRGRLSRTTLVSFMDRMRGPAGR